MQDKRLIELLNKHLPESEHKNLAILREQLNRQDMKVNVVVYGSYNVGKSSLLNSLTEQLENEFFLTNDVPETRTNKVYEKDSVRFIDTPGLDVNDEDTEQAESGAFQGDIIIFVHKLTAGSIQQQDLDAMQKIYYEHGDPNSVLFVVTSSELMKPHDTIVRELTQQVGEFLSPNVDISFVSNKFYKRGVVEDKAKFVEISNINQLQQTLEAKVALVSDLLEDKRVKKINGQLGKYLELIEVKRKQLEIQRQQCLEKEMSFVSAVQKLKLGISRQLKQIQAL
ncbi:GTPase [Vibrio parahaemolyticus]|uniref:GTPase n=2 Tax=Vibrio parahaemolyticus TaxID=670 RepID=UPI0015DE342B|nr:GTPase domain-containing protein [Vibrio parahaemolyticus]EJG1634280.1 GTPase domain-containing protein [Vibrio parahaemolyticus]ELA7162284.1 GTPase domain-containing protein [Vibrio parahaemolyticus]ELA8128370.1 GTPase domain-containing protein [Vibrio parahaemolyticus]HBI3712006.1 GTPase domain-containing protein [Vibrio parahaemolyticus]